MQKQLVHGSSMDSRRTPHNGVNDRLRKPCRVVDTAPEEPVTRSGSNSLMIET